MEKRKCFLVDTALFYSGAFSTSSPFSPNGSAAGFCMVPLTKPYDSRELLYAVRSISFTAPAGPSNEVLEFSILGINHGATDGFEGVDGECRPRRISLDFCGFLDE